MDRTRNGWKRCSAYRTQTGRETCPKFKDGMMIDEMDKNSEVCLTNGEAKKRGTLIECFFKERCPHQMKFGHTMICKQNLKNETGIK